jgi:uncharacterized membrane protein YeaQ/YmgE (transglycosylase-associated protein family)
MRSGAFRVAVLHLADSAFVSSAAMARGGFCSCRDATKGDTMDAQGIIIWLIVGAIAGWLAGMVIKGGGFGLIGDIIVGIIGALIAGWLLPQLGIIIGGGVIGAIINAFIGAVILLIILRLIKR